METKEGEEKRETRSERKHKRRRETTDFMDRSEEESNMREGHSMGAILLCMREWDILRDGVKRLQRSPPERATYTTRQERQ